MSILKIARMGHPVLRSVASPVEDPASPEIRRLVNDMIETMADAQGVGLAAPQVYVPKRLVIFFVPRDRGDPVPLTVLINPVVEPLGGETDEVAEGCLSLPGMVGVVPRWTRVRYRGIDMSGNGIVREAEGFHARVVQHECDHLDGVLYPMRMADLSRFGFAEEIRRGFAMRFGGDGGGGEKDETVEGDSI
ncbi:MAG: peptide deformylase [Alphaproteobacteria bacterium]|nr:peptide deformylase [Alphaproteobacteria bacterium]